MYQYTWILFTPCASLHFLLFQTLFMNCINVLSAPESTVRTESPAAATHRNRCFIIISFFKGSHQMSLAVSGVRAWLFYELQPDRFVLGWPMTTPPALLWHCAWIVMKWPRPSPVAASFSTHRPNHGETGPTAVLLVSWTAINQHRSTSALFPPLLFTSVPLVTFIGGFLHWVIQHLLLGERIR